MKNPRHEFAEVFQSRVRSGVLLFALMLSACGGSVELIGALPENEANEMLAVLLNANIEARKVPAREGQVALHVESGKVALALDTLRVRGLPRERFAGMGDIFRKEGLISSPLEERVRYLYALAQELSNTISKIDGVIVARVHVVLPERASTGDPSVPSSAAVFVKHQEGYNLDTVQPQIRRLVVNSIPNLTTDRVSIVLVSAQHAQDVVTSNAGSPAMRGREQKGGDSNEINGHLHLILGLILAALSGVAAWVSLKILWPRWRVQRNKAAENSSAGMPLRATVFDEGPG